MGGGGAGGAQDGAPQRGGGGGRGGGSTTSHSEGVSTPFAYLVTVSSTQYSVELKPHQLHFVRRYPPQYYCFIADRYTHLYGVAAGGDGVEGEGGGGGSYNFGGR